MKYKFYYPLRVRYAETDAQGHVFFGHYLTYFDVGLTEYTRAIGYTYPDMVASGVDMFYVELYESLGNEVRVGPVTPDLQVTLRPAQDVAEECTACLLTACERYVVIYTRPRGM